MCSQVHLKKKMRLITFISFVLSLDGLGGLGW